MGAQIPILKQNLAIDLKFWPVGFGLITFEEVFPTDVETLKIGCNRGSARCIKGEREFF